MEESSSLEEEQCTQLNQKYKQLHGENWTHVEKLMREQSFLGIQTI